MTQEQICLKVPDSVVEKYLPYLHAHPTRWKIAMILRPFMKEVLSNLYWGIAILLAFAGGLGLLMPKSYLQGLVVAMKIMLELEALFILCVLLLWALEKHARRVEREMHTFRRLLSDRKISHDNKMSNFNWETILPLLAIKRHADESKEDKLFTMLPAKHASSEKTLNRMKGPNGYSINGVSLLTKDLKYQDWRFEVVGNQNNGRIAYHLNHLWTLLLGYEFEIVSRQG